MSKNIVFLIDRNGLNAGGQSFIEEVVQKLGEEVNPFFIGFSKTASEVKNMKGLIPSRARSHSPLNSILKAYEIIDKAMEENRIPNEPCLIVVITCGKLCNSDTVFIDKAKWRLHEQEGAYAWRHLIVGKGAENLGELLEVPSWRINETDVNKADDSEFLCQAISDFVSYGDCGFVD